MPRRLRPLVALTLIALIGAGCGESASSGSGSTTADTARQQSVKFARCMRGHGVGDFPDPGPSGGLTIDGVVNGSSLDTSSPTWKAALSACKRLQPPGFMGDQHVTPAKHARRLAFAQCMRDHGVKDFPDPADGEPLVDTNKIPSAARAGGMTIINAAMHQCGDAARAAMSR